MQAILMWSKAEFRGRWRAWLGLAILIGLFGGVVLAAAAGGRRTDTSWKRFLETSRAWDAATFYVAWDPSFADLDPDEVEALPSVAEHSRARYFISTDEFSGLVADDTYTKTIAIPKFLEGRAPTAIDEVSVPYALSLKKGLHVGDPMPIRFQGGAEESFGQDVVLRRMRVVGVHLNSGVGEFPPGGGRESGLVLLSRAFTDAHVTDIANIQAGFMRLHGGSAAIPAFRKQLESVAGGKPFFVTSQPELALAANKAVHLVAMGLWILGAVVAFVALLAFGQTIARQFSIEGERFPTGRALGLTRSQMFAIGMFRALMIGTAASSVAVVVAAALSPFAPVGIARVAEPSPGFALDVFALGWGALGIILAVGASSVIPAWRAERSASSRDQQGTRRSRLARVAFRAGLPASAVTGIRLALEPGRGRTAVPVRSTLGAATVGIAAVIIAATFGASLDRLLGSGDSFGLTWDLEVQVELDERGGDGRTAGVEGMIRELDGVRDAAIADAGIPLRIDGVTAVSLSMDLTRSALAPPLVQGRYPTEKDEIALGTRTMSATKSEVGDTVEVQLEGLEPKRFEVVGVAILPGFDTQAGLGEGGLVSPASVHRFLDSPPPVTTIFVRLSEGADRGAATEAISKIAGVTSVEAPALPEELRNLQRVDAMPTILAGILAILAAAAIAHGLTSSVRRRSRDLAILLALGFVRRQIRATVRWQSLTFAIAALMLGIPTGVAIGRWLWRVSASELGVLPDPAVPMPVLGAAGVGSIVIAIVVSALPARRAARTRPATILRAE